jgi:hypothetical protein
VLEVPVTTALPALLPVHTIYIDDGKHLTEGNDEQGDGTSVLVQQGQPVLAGVQCENEGDEICPKADDTCAQRGSRAVVTGLNLPHTALSP